MKRLLLRFRRRKKLREIDREMKTIAYHEFLANRAKSKAERAQGELWKLDHQLGMIRQGQLK